MEYKRTAGPRRSAANLLINLIAMLLAGTGALALGCASSGHGSADRPAYGSMGQPQIFENMGPHTRPVTTTSPDAQRYFDQGLNWLYSFNHDEAVLSFTKAAELDPGCAMAWWGIAYAQGPNYNDPIMSPARNAAAWNALGKAQAALDDESPAERALIDALASRYSQTPPEDRTDLNAAFAKSMSSVWAQFPGDSDVGAVYADSVMLLHPWQLYRSDGTPARKETVEVVEVLEQVLEAHPNNPGANHLYIHAVEASNDKARGIVAADRLSNLNPASGHMLHMPSHIYVQVGMWDRAIEQSHKAMQCDAQYRVLSPDQLVQHGYMAHNAHMLAFAAMMVGREDEALAAARAMWDHFPEQALRENAAYVDFSMCAVYDVLKRFGRWDELLAEPAPPAYLPITTAIWRAHRAVAYAAKKDIKAADKEHRLFREAMRAIPAETPSGFYGDVMQLLLVSEFFVAAEISLQEGEFETAAGLLEQAARIEDALGYGEPPAWLQPVRHTLGVAYLKDGKYADAERVYRADLTRWPGNGWSLLGLSQALAAQGDEAGALAARTEFERIWPKADTAMSSSCRCIQDVAAR